MSATLAKGNLILGLYELCKPRVVMLLVITAMVGMLLAVPSLSLLAIDTFVFASIGITLASASAAAINQIVEEQLDQQMQRTQKRPLVQGQISSQQAIIFAVFIGLVAELVLWLLVNPLTAVLTFAGLIGYALVYTLYLKHATPQNIVIGGASGAMPPVLGWAAMTNELSLEPFLLFLIIFIWTPPHFWALAIYRQEDYAKTQVPMLTVTHGIAYTRWQIVYYKLLLLAVSLLPFIIGMSHLIYLCSALVLGGWYLSIGYRMIRQPNDRRLAIKSFGVSIWYLLLLFVALIIDHFWTISL